MSKNIKKYLALNDVGRNDICEALGFKYSTFSDWVNGNKYPRIDKIEMMANYFGISKSDLVEDSMNKKSDGVLSDEDVILINFLYKHPEHRIAINYIITLDDSDIKVVNESFRKSSRNRLIAYAEFLKALEDEPKEG